MSRAQVFSGLDFLEESFLLRAGAPGPKALRKWRREAPDGAAFSLVAPEGVFGDESERAAAMNALAGARDALEAAVVIFRTPTSLAPSQQNRDRFRALCRETADELDGAQPVLWTRGLWDRALGAKLADELDVLLAIDPLANDPLEELPALVAAALELGRGYLRLDRIGSPRRRFDPYELEMLAEIAAELDDGWICFAHSERVRDAIDFCKLLAND